MSYEDDLVDMVDELVDDLNPLRVDEEAQRFGISVAELLDRVLAEAKARLDA